MNSIIEAQDEFLQWIFFARTIEPDMPIAQKPHEAPIHLERRFKAWQKRNHASIHRNLGEYWDRKMADENDRKFVAQVDGYRFEKIVDWPIYTGKDAADATLCRRLYNFKNPVKGPNGWYDANK